MDRRTRLSELYTIGQEYNMGVVLVVISVLFSGGRFCLSDFLMSSCWSDYEQFTSLSSSAPVKISKYRRHNLVTVFHHNGYLLFTLATELTTHWFGAL